MRIYRRLGSVLVIGIFGTLLIGRFAYFGIVFIGGSGMSFPSRMVHINLHPAVQYRIYRTSNYITHFVLRQKILSQTRPSRFYITATTYQPRDPEVIVFNPVRRAINTFIFDLFHKKNKNNMRPSPRLFQQAARAPSMLQRFANSPMSPPVEAYPLFVLITGMVSPPLFCLSFQMQKDHSLFSLSDSFVLTRLFSCFFSCLSACTLHIASSSTTAI